MTEVHGVPHCGTEMAPDSPEGVCPRCVLRLGWPGSGAGEVSPTASHRPDSKFVAPAPAS